MEVLELTKSLISCPSVTPKNEGVLDLLEKELSEIGFKCHRYLFSDHNTPDVDNLFAKFGNGSPHLCFGGHTDVCLLYTSPSPRDLSTSRMPASA